MAHPGQRGLPSSNRHRLWTKPGVLRLVGERNLPILCEKPLTPEVASSWRIVEAEQRRGKKRIQVGFMRRFDAEYQRLRGLITSGELGELLMLHCAHRNPETPPGFTNEMFINDSVVHEFDVIRYLTGDEINSVQVRLGRAPVTPPPANTIRNTSSLRPKAACWPMQKSSSMRNSATR